MYPWAWSPQPTHPLQSVDGAANGPSMTVLFQCSHNDNQALVLAREPFRLLKGTWLSALMGHYLWILNLSFQTTVLFPFFPRHWQKPRSFCALSTSPNLFVLETKKIFRDRGVTVTAWASTWLWVPPEATFVPIPASCEYQLHLSLMEAPQCGPPSTSYPSCSCFVSLEASLV